MEDEIVLVGKAVSQAWKKIAFNSPFIDSKRSQYPCISVQVATTNYQSLRLRLYPSKHGMLQSHIDMTCHRNV